MTDSVPFWPAQLCSLDVPEAAPPGRSTLLENMSAVRGYGYVPLKALKQEPRFGFDRLLNQTFNIICSQANDK